MVEPGKSTGSKVESASLAPLRGLMEALELLVAQARAYDQILPRDNYPARAASAALGELAQRALNEARHLEAALQPALERPRAPRRFRRARAKCWNWLPRA